MTPNRGPVNRCAVRGCVFVGYWPEGGTCREHTVNDRNFYAVLRRLQRVRFSNFDFRNWRILLDLTDRPDARRPSLAEQWEVDE